MCLFIKIRNTLLCMEEIKSVYPEKYRDHNGLEQDRVVVVLKDGDKYKFSIDSSCEVEAFINDIFGCITRENSYK